MLEGKEVTWFPSYGAEIRGGTTNCTVIISDEPIGSPVVTNADILIAMNEESLRKFQPRLKHNGFLMFDSSIVKDTKLRTDVEIVGIPATEISSTVGNKKSANMVLLGLFIAKTRLLREMSVFEVLETLMPKGDKKGIEMNKKAIIEGMRFIES